MRDDTLTLDLYIDVLMLVNFSWNLLILKLLKKIMKLPGSWLRLILSSLTGTLWTLATVCFPVLPMAVERAVTVFLVSLVMVAMAYRPGTCRLLVRELLGFYLAAATVGGISYGLSLSIGRNFLMFPVTALGALLLWEVVLEHRVRNRNLYQVILHSREKSIEVTALLDTGNHLREPVTGRPVHILTEQAARSLCGELPYTVDIPYQSVGQPGGILHGFHLDSMEVQMGKEHITVIRPLVAVTGQPLSPSGEYELLLHEEIAGGINHDR